MCISVRSRISIFLFVSVFVFGCGAGDGNLTPDNDSDKTSTWEDVVSSSKSRVLSPQVSKGDVATQVSGNSTFAFDLYHAIKSGNKNLFYSPHSISVALAMTYAGARNQTEQVMGQVLNFGLPQRELHPVFNYLDLELNSRGQGAKAADG
ncbi:MAG: serpin family protein, partial [Pseudomonadota bacterium]